MRNSNRIAIICAGFFLLAPLALAQQTEVPIRAGEHPTYSRLVIPASSDLAWELRSFGREATLMLPTVDTRFLTDRIFDRIPRTRILNVSSEVVAGDTFLKLRLACDCEVSAKVERGNLILDVIDIDDDEAVANVNADAPKAPLNRPLPRPSASVQKDGSDFPSDLADRLISQLNKAAEQGIIELNEPTEEQVEVSDILPKDPEAVDPDPAEVGLQPIEETLDGLDSIAERVQQELSDTLDINELGNSIRITIPEELVEPEQNKPIRKNSQQLAETTKDPMEHCVDDAFLDVAYWADMRPYSTQAAALKARVFGEFDEPDAEAVLELARFFIFYGLGTEAKSLLKDLKLDQYQSEILYELANTVEGKPHVPGGILDKAAGCPGAVALWRTAALDMTETQPLSDTDELIEAFADLPIEVRRMIGPRLVQSFITRNQITAANRIFAIVERAAGYHGSEHELRRADLRLLDGDREAAEQIYWRLVYDGSDVSAKAAEALVQSMLERKAAIPSNVLTVLEALAFEFRGSRQGNDLLLTAIKAKAGSNGLAEAIRISLNEIENAPDASASYFRAIDAALADASVMGTGAEEYLSVIFDNLGLINGRNISDKTKTIVARETMAAGLPNTTLQVVDALEAPDFPEISTIAAAAAWKLRKTDTVFELSQQTPNDGTLASFASMAHSSLGQHDEAILALSGIEDRTEPHALNWRAGNWDEAVQSPSQQISLLAAFMKSRGISGAMNSDQSEIETAVTQAIPIHDKITLKYARDVQTQSETVRKFLRDTIAEM